MSIVKNPVSVIIVNYNSSKDIVGLLKSFHLINKIIGEIIVFDNNSDKLNIGILKKLKNVNLIFSNVNLGFSKAVNYCLSISKYDISLLINPDCLVVDNSPIHTFNIIAANKKIGIIGGKILNSRENLFQNTATTKPNFWTGIFEFTNFKKIFPTNFASKKFWVENNYHGNKPIQVFSVCGAYLFIRKSNGKINNFFNTKYFLYLEDLDIGYMMAKNEQEVWLDPESIVIHKGGGSNNSVFHTVLKYWYNSRKLFFLNHTPPYQSLFLLIIFILEEYLLRIFHLIVTKPNE